MNGWVVFFSLNSLGMYVVHACSWHGTPSHAGAIVFAILSASCAGYLWKIQP